MDSLQLSSRVIAEQMIHNWFLQLNVLRITTAKQLAGSVVVVADYARTSTIAIKIFSELFNHQHPKSKSKVEGEL